MRLGLLDTFASSKGNTTESRSFDGVGASALSADIRPILAAIIVHSSQMQLRPPTKNLLPYEYGDAVPRSTRVFLELGSAVGQIFRLVAKAYPYYSRSTEGSRSERETMLAPRGLLVETWPLLIG